MKKFLQNQEGFTLIELLVVLGIIAVLTVVAINILGAQRSTDYNTRTKTLLRGASTLISDWPNDSNNTSPGDWSSLWPYMSSSGQCSSTASPSPHGLTACLLSSDSTIVWQDVSDSAPDGTNPCLWPAEAN